LVFFFFFVFTFVLRPHFAEANQANRFVRCFADSFAEEVPQVCKVGELDGDFD
jgi:hypothetical protein